MGQQYYEKGRKVFVGLGREPHDGEVCVALGDMVVFVHDYDSDCGLSREQHEALAEVPCKAPDGYEFSLRNGSLEFRAPRENEYYMGTQPQCVFLCGRELNYGQFGKDGKRYILRPIAQPAAQQAVQSVGEKVNGLDNKAALRKLRDALVYIPGVISKHRTKEIIGRIDKLLAKPPEPPAREPNGRRRADWRLCCVAKTLNFTNHWKDAKGERHLERRSGKDRRADSTTRKQWCNGMAVTSSDKAFGTTEQRRLGYQAHKQFTEQS